MNALSFISSIVESISWPLAIVALVLILKHPVSTLLPTLRRFRYGKVEVDFGNELRELAKEVKSAGFPVGAESPPKQEVSRRTDDTIIDAMLLAKEFPAAAVSLAWSTVEHELMQAVMRLAISADYPTYNSAIKNVHLLHDHGHIEEETKGVVERLRGLRNAAVHAMPESREMSEGEAREFAELAQAVAKRLKGITR